MQEAETTGSRDTSCSVGGPAAERDSRVKVAKSVEQIFGTCLGKVK